MADTLMPAIVEAPPVDERRRPPRVRKTPTTYVLRFIAMAYLFFLVAWPVSLVVKHTFDGRVRLDPSRSSTTPTSVARSS